MDAGQCAGIFAERPTEWIAVSNPRARVHVHVSTIMQYLCMCTCSHVNAHVCVTCRYAAVHVNRPSGISQAAAIAVNRTQGVNRRHINSLIGFELPCSTMDRCSPCSDMIMVKNYWKNILFVKIHELKTC